LKHTLAILLLALLVAPAVSAENPSVDQLRQMMTEAANNLSTYAYSRSADSGIMYSNQTLQEKFTVIKETVGKVDLPAEKGWWSSVLTDLESGDVLTWEGYLVNGSEYWNENQNWTHFLANNTSLILEEYNEYPGQVALISLLDMQIEGIEQCGNEECYRLAGSPSRDLLEGMAALQLLASYFASPFPLPDELGNASFDIDDTSLLENTDMNITAWVSTNTSLLKRLDIRSSMMVTPEILRISEPDFKIESSINESTVYSGFGEAQSIDLPEEAQNESFRLVGTDWRWAAFGSVRP